TTSAFETVPRIAINRATGTGSDDTNKTASRMAFSSLASIVSARLFGISTPISLAESPGIPLPSIKDVLSSVSWSTVEFMLPSIQHHPILPGPVRARTYATPELAQNVLPGIPEQFEAA